MSPIRHHALDSPAIAHGFLTRAGGVSGGIFSGLNCGLGSGDDPKAVAENRARAVAHLAGATPAPLVTLYQIHSADVVQVIEPWAPGQGPKADAMVTDRPGLVLGILTADCGPILFADPEAQVIGAAHAGWKGAKGGIALKTVEAMEKLGAKRERISAVLGPCISQANYEVGADFEKAFLADDPAHGQFFAPGKQADKRQFDLIGFILAGLKAEGISAHTTGHCTYGDEGLFFSFRRATHRGEPDYGRGLSAIMLRAGP